MRVLVVEDDPRLARQITRELQRNNHEPRACNNGAEGLEMALVDPPDLIVLDLNLPGLGWIICPGTIARRSFHCADSHPYGARRGQ
jgi:DNA-binding response OmpR family regulator